MAALSHDLLPPGGTVRAVAGLPDGGGPPLVRVWVLRGGRQAATVRLEPSCGGAFWRLMSLAGDPPGTLWLDPVAGTPWGPCSPDLLPGEAFSLAASEIARQLAVQFVSLPPRDPLSPSEEAVLASLPGVLKGILPALEVMLA